VRFSGHGTSRKADGSLAAFESLFQVAERGRPELVPVAAGRCVQLEQPCFQGAALRLRDWAFGERGLSRLISLIHPENVQSIHVAERIGEQYEREVVLRGHPTKLYSLGARESFPR
jgi:hypothetical protein